MALRIGSLRARLVLEVPAETPDGAGGVRRSFVAAATVWARVETLRGQEGVYAGSPGQALTHRVTMRYRDGVDASMRLRLGSRLLAIRTVFDPQERGRALACLCEEVSP